MPTRQHKEQLLKLRILAFLKKDTCREFGTHADDIKMATRVDRKTYGVEFERVLNTLVEQGLVERRQDQTNKNHKPYFITDAGIRFFEEQTQSAMFPEFTQKSDWAEGRTQATLADVMSDHLRTLPEFASAKDDRMQEVSAELANLAKRHISPSL